LKESEMKSTVKTKQVQFINEGRESHDWGFSDKKGRALGSRVAFCVKVFEEFVPENGESCLLVAPGTYFCWLAQATRGGEDFGACQPWNFCNTEQERQAAVAKYLAGARSRAKRWAV
jgi:hypothetical protein